MRENSLPDIVAHLQAAPAWQRKQDIALLTAGLASLAPTVAGVPVRLGGRLRDRARGYRIGAHRGAAGTSLETKG
jgi:hypothetical protein